jgi:hypothetical protein
MSFQDAGEQHEPVVNAVAAGQQSRCLFAEFSDGSAAVERPVRLVSRSMSNATKVGRGSDGRYVSRGPPPAPQNRFLGRCAGQSFDVALLELLLTHAIPQRDVRPLTERLFAHFGTLEAVFAAEPAVPAQSMGSLSIQRCSLPAIRCANAPCSMRTMR